MAGQSKIPCSESLHPFFESCRLGPYFFRTALLASLKIYFPLFLASGLLSRKLFSFPYIFYKFLPSVLRSSMMIAIIGYFWGDLVCRLRNLFGAHFGINYFVAPFVGSLIGILIEKKERRGELVVYVLNNVVDNAYRMLLSRGLVPSVRHGLTYMFAAAMGLLFFFQRYERALLGSSEAAFVRFVIGGADESQPSDPLEAWLARRYDALRRLVLSEPSPAAEPLLPTAEVERSGCRWCLHKRSCVAHAAIGFTKAFLVGYGLQCLLRLLPSLFAVRKWMLAKSRRKILGNSFGKTAMKFGLFLALLSGGTRSVQCALRHVRQKEDGWNQLLAGMAGGLSFLLSGSVELCLFMASKACDVCYKYAKKQGYVTPLPGSQVILFSLATSTIFWILFWEPHNLRPSYLSYLSKATNGLFSDLVVSTHPVRMASGMSAKNQAAYIRWYNQAFPRFLKEASTPWGRQNYKPTAT